MKIYSTNQWHWIKETGYIIELIFIDTLQEGNGILHQKAGIYFQSVLAVIKYDMAPTNGCKCQYYV